LDPLRGPVRPRGPFKRVSPPAPRAATPPGAGRAGRRWGSGSRLREIVPAWLGSLFRSGTAADRIATCAAEMGMLGRGFKWRLGRFLFFALEGYAYGPYTQPR